MKSKKKYLIMIPLLFLSTLIYVGCQPLREFNRIPAYQGDTHYNPLPLIYDSSKKTVAIIAKTEGTEIFDLMAPFYLLNAAEKANVYIVAEKKNPIALLKGVFAMPNLTFKEMDSLKIQPDVIVLPAMVKVFKEPNSATIKWIKEKYNDKTKILSVCAGSLVASATGIYDGKTVTTHASDFAESKAYFKKPNWVSNIAVTQEGNLYSTAGVSNAVEGSLTIINDLFGTETLHKVMDEIHYPYSKIKTEHQSLAVATRNKFTIANKLIFKKNRHVGVLLQNGINELALAAVLDTYSRSFPASNQTVVLNGSSVKSKYGLLLFPTAKMDTIKLDELHVLMPENFLASESKKFGTASIVSYSLATKPYIIDTCLKRISEQYGNKFKNITKLLLDYN
ncbi:DJ-1/PfpI family protein [Flavobacterium sp. ZS1P14]|uniref:DJ-1/PfpI family protein n=1 Tax=Flavobacterium sp. ZS1P14 TaxID=3401729 RepID=UPI003AB0BB41